MSHIIQCKIDLSRSELGHSTASCTIVFALKSFTLEIKAEPPRASIIEPITVERDSTHRYRKSAVWRVDIEEGWPKDCKTVNVHTATQVLYFVEVEASLAKALMEGVFT